MFNGFVFYKKDVNNLRFGIVKIKANLKGLEPKKEEDKVTITQPVGKMGGKPRIDIIEGHSSILIRGEVSYEDYNTLKTYKGFEEGIFFEDPDGEHEVCIVKVTPNSNDIRVYKKISVEMVVMG